MDSIGGSTYSSDEHELVVRDAALQSFSVPTLPQMPESVSQHNAVQQQIAQEISDALVTSVPIAKMSEWRKKLCRESVFDSEKSRDRLLEYISYAADFIAFVRWYKAYVAAYKDIRVDQVNRWAMTIENARRERDAAWYNGFIAPHACLCDAVVSRKLQAYTEQLGKNMTSKDAMNFLDFLFVLYSVVLKGGIDSHNSFSEMFHALIQQNWELIRKCYEQPQVYPNRTWYRMLIDCGVLAPIVREKKAMESVPRVKKERAVKEKKPKVEKLPAMKKEKTVKEQSVRPEKKLDRIIVVHMPRGRNVPVATTTYGSSKVHVTPAITSSRGILDEPRTNMNNTPVVPAALLDSQIQVPYELTFAGMSPLPVTKHVPQKRDPIKKNFSDGMKGEAIAEKVKVVSRKSPVVEKKTKAEISQALSMYDNLLKTSVSNFEGVRSNHVADLWSSCGVSKLQLYVYLISRMVLSDAQKETLYKQCDLWDDEYEAAVEHVESELFYHRNLSTSLWDIKVAIRHRYDGLKFMREE